MTKAHENTSAFIKPGSSQHIQSSYTFLDTGYKKLSFKIEIQKSQKDKNIKFFVLLKSIRLVHKVISQRNLSDVDNANEKSLR